LPKPVWPLNQPLPSIIRTQRVSPGGAKIETPIKGLSVKGGIRASGCDLTIKGACVKWACGCTNQDVLA
jgi:hypothetical protein